MVRYASVIVDVPARQTNRAFTYEIPHMFSTANLLGARVTVPFAGRMLQGIIIDLHERLENSEINENKIKVIHELLDIEPSFTNELLKLAKWMSETYVTPFIFCLYAMLPTALKARYDKQLQVNPQRIEEQLVLSDSQLQIIAWIEKKTQPLLSKCLQAFPAFSSDLFELIALKLVTESAYIQDRQQTKQISMIRALANHQQLQEELQRTRKTAAQQQKIIQYFLDQTEHYEIPMSVLSEQLNISKPALQALESRGCLTMFKRESYRDPFAMHTFTLTTALPLTIEQRHAFTTVNSCMRNRRHQTFLLHGITGSGKTELYMQLIQECIHRQRQAIVLVPEIALTPQMTERFKGRFGEQVAVIHSQLSTGERYDEWRKIRRGEVDVVVGARSAVFAPFKNLGIIIIDEEHETSYKQEDAPKYHARDVARWRCSEHEAPLLLGSATPTLESYARCDNDYILIEMNSRATNMPLPPVSIIDMRAQLRQGNRSMFSDQLRQALINRCEKQEQSILFLNRRGYSTSVMCRSCGAASSCPHCDITLTYHKSRQRLICHYCAYEQAVKQQCDACGSSKIGFFGTGTQRVEEALTHEIPGIRVIRMDVDTTAKKGAHEKLLTAFSRHEADVLLGTQMISKGLDFANVTLVGVITADTTLHMPDFRAAERTFQMLTQVAGRAGRADKHGEVLIQTYNPDHYSIQLAANHDYRSFAKRELLYRESLFYPPYCRIILFNLSHTDLSIVIQASEKLAAYAREFRTTHAPECIEILGPVPAPIAKMKDRYRYQCVVKYIASQEMREFFVFIGKQMESWIQTYKLQIGIDVDPQMMM
jgi:primosomal protein N' (replication factor Y)